MFFKFVASFRVFLFLLSRTNMNGFVKIHLMIVQIDRLSPKPRRDTIIGMSFSFFLLEIMQCIVDTVSQLDYDNIIN